MAIYSKLQARKQAAVLVALQLSTNEGILVISSYRASVY
jgi:hypothetical protein